jgi:hypothetical protein
MYLFLYTLAQENASTIGGGRELDDGYSSQQKSFKHHMCEFQLMEVGWQGARE